MRSFCIIWNEKTEKFLKTMCPKCPSVQTVDTQGTQSGHIKNSKCPSVQASKDMDTLDTLGKTSVQTASVVNKGFGHMDTLDTSFSEKNNLELEVSEDDEVKI
jgi:hypothetical protein